MKLTSRKMSTQQKIYTIIALMPMTLGTYFGSFTSLEKAQEALGEHLKECAEDIPENTYFNIFSHDLNEPLPVQFKWEKKVVVKDE
jgi:hypothetical protein